jgi:hypothetical protein
VTTEASGLVASCICGRSRITLPHAPDFVSHCNCSMCTKTGFWGIYYPSEELRIEGEFDTFVREDLDEVFLRLHRCKHCGAQTHWTLLTDPPYERMGVNARLLNPPVLEGVEVRDVDGASW